CQVCSQFTDTIEHFLVECPAKWPVWCALYNHFFSSCPPKQSDVLSHIFSLKLPPDPLDIRSSQIIGSVLGELWRAHWRLIFDDIPFSSSMIISS
ncbi:hypothetical protein BDF14DRAFT_1692605, partial [Spinellus fusiger]